MWSWVWPELLGHDRAIAWLFSPVTGNTTWPGDLWGVDEAGQLIVVEAKTCKPGTKVDPFVDFVEAGASVADGTSSVTSAAALRKRWHRLLDLERTFIRQHSAALQAGARLTGCYPGVVPYSFHRASVQRWRHLYLEHLAYKLSGSDYEARVEEHLRTREREGNGKAVIVALLSVLEGGAPLLSRSGKRHLRTLSQAPTARPPVIVSVYGRLIDRSVRITADLVPDAIAR